MAALKTIFVSVITAVMLLGGTATQEVTSTQLIEEAKAYDTKEIIYTGEVIGDIMQRGDHSWVNVSDGSNAIGVWILSDLVRDIKFTGRYKVKGDTVKVTGIFYRACKEHGGDMDIHASDIKILKQGYKISEATSIWQAVFTVLGLVLTILLSIHIFRKKL
ncbi:MAG: DNA-binding protein [Actinomycetota bacterium]|nr:DNA-binding protein [Actinomycetota bacterium]